MHRLLVLPLRTLRGATRFPLGREAPHILQMGGAELDLWSSAGNEALQSDFGGLAAAGCAAAWGARPTTTVRRP